MTAGVDFFGMGVQGFVEKRFVTPAKAGVQNIKINKIINTLDSGLRRNDGFGVFHAFQQIPMRKHEIYRKLFAHPSVPVSFNPGFFKSNNLTPRSFSRARFFHANHKFFQRQAARLVFPLPLCFRD
jgi:hypothetical protein